MIVIIMVMPVPAADGQLSDRRPIGRWLKHDRHVARIYPETASRM
jgi:hypothetical protein